MSYELVVPRRVRKAVARLPENVYGRVSRAIDRLVEEPRPHGCIMMRGEEDLWRIRVGDYRVVYAIDDERRVVEILKVAHRRESYR